ncbi:MAG: hypothetical protein ACQESP_11685, partial [Candidatus Muiribacteriota bacterium]
EIDLKRTEVIKSVLYYVLKTNDVAGGYYILTLNNIITASMLVKSEKIYKKEDVVYLNCSISFNNDSDYKGDSGLIFNNCSVSFFNCLIEAPQIDFVSCKNIIIKNCNFKGGGQKKDWITINHEWRNNISDNTVKTEYVLIANNYFKSISYGFIHRDGLVLKNIKKLILSENEFNSLFSSRHLFSLDSIESVDINENCFIESGVDLKSPRHLFGLTHSFFLMFFLESLSMNLNIVQKCYGEHFCSNSQGGIGFGSGIGSGSQKSSEIKGKILKTKFENCDFGKGLYSISASPQLIIKDIEENQHV